MLISHVSIVSVRLISHQQLDMSQSIPTSNAFVHGEGFHVNSSQARVNLVFTFVEIRVFQACTCSQRSDLTLVPNRCCCALGALRKCARFPFLPCVSPHSGCPCAHSVDCMTNSLARVMAQEQNSAHPFTFFHQLGSGAHGTNPC